MNTPNNKRRRESVVKMEKVFVELLQHKELNQITVAEICKQAGLNRTTFYANYQDVYALADSIRDKLLMELAVVYEQEIAGRFHSYDYLKLFQHIRDNQLFYKTYLKLGYEPEYQTLIIHSDPLAEQHFGNRFVDYHAAFFKSGLTSIIKLWLDRGCRETPEEMNEILESEYGGRSAQKRAVPLCDGTAPNDGVSRPG